MKIKTFSGDVTALETDLLAFTVSGDVETWPATLRAVDEALDGLLRNVVEEQDFRGKPDSNVVLHTHGRIGPKRVAVLGVGPDATEATAMRNHAAAAVQLGDALRLKSVAAIFPSPEAEALEAGIRFACEGAELGLYRFNAHRTQDVIDASVERFVVGFEDGELVAMDESMVDRIRTIAAAVSAAINLARDLVNEGPRTATPQRLAEVAEQIAKDEGLECTIMGMKEIQERKMELLLAVNAGSDLDPCLIHLTYRPEGGGDDLPSIAFVGKGLTFDAGGYNLKPTGAIDDMKIDMAGGAAVLGAMKAISAIAPRCIVHGIVPSTENLVNGSAFKLGDVYTGQNGKTVEIRNTDAEGRLILADALCYANEQNVDELLSLATLTGACVIALGPYTCGIFSNHDSLRDTMLECCERVGEDAWPLPLNKKLKRMLKSDVADIKNVGERWGGAITAGLFLQEFVDETAWIHLDLAGPSYISTIAEPHIPKGGTGWGVLSLLEFASHRSRD